LALALEVQVLEEKVLVEVVATLVAVLALVFDFLLGKQSLN
tara:strand:- start:133 stop:255 length:123 start_codon:yes stop_codon:yes gene_type:complete